MTRRLSILNDILGPVMRGPSSSHAAAPYAIGKTARALSTTNGDKIIRAKVKFDPKGSFAHVYSNQGSDEAFAAGLGGIEFESPEYLSILSKMRKRKDPFEFIIEITPLKNNNHPNRVDIVLTCQTVNSETREDVYYATSTGGGMFLFENSNGVDLLQDPRNSEQLTPSTKKYCSADEILLEIRKSGKDIPRIVDEYEAEIMNVSCDRIRILFKDRLNTMFESVRNGLKAKKSSYMKYLTPCSSIIDSNKNLSIISGPQLYSAIIGALSVMELCSNRGIICAAPTAGSGGIIPGCLYSLYSCGMETERLIDALKTMGLVGLIIGNRATFAAECCGCAAETGSAAAMAAAGITYLYEKEAVFKSASICLMNTMGLICDPVGGEVEIPCHSRNIAGVAHAYAAATAAAGGFDPKISFDDAVDTMREIGTKIHPDFLCTAQGGLAICSTALKLSNRQQNQS